VKHLHRTLCTALNTAVKFGCVARNVAALVDPPSAPRSKITFLTIDQARAFLDFAKHDRLFARTPQFFRLDYA